MKKKYQGHLIYHCNRGRSLIQDHDYNLINRCIGGYTEPMTIIRLFQARDLRRHLYLSSLSTVNDHFITGSAVCYYSLMRDYNPIRRLNFSPCKPTVSSDIEYGNYMRNDTGFRSQTGKDLIKSEEMNFKKSYKQVVFFSSRPSERKFFFNFILTYLRHVQFHLINARSNQSSYLKHAFVFSFFLFSKLKKKLK